MNSCHHADQPLVFPHKNNHFSLLQKCHFSSLQIFRFLLQLVCRNMILSLIVPQTLVLVFNNISDGHCCNIIIVLVTIVPRTKIRKVVGPIILFPTVSFLYLCESQGCIYIQFALSLNFLTKIPCSVSFPELQVFDPLHFIIASSTDGSCLGIYMY